MSKMLTHPEVDIDQSPIALLELTNRRRIRGLNSAAEILFGLSRQAARGRKLSELLYHDCALFDLIDRAEETEANVSSFALELKGPSLRNLRPQQASVGMTAEGGFSIGILRSSSSEEPVTDMAGLAAFGRILGHEVKNPLAGISGATQLLLRKARDDQKELLDLVLAESARIARLVDKLSAFELFSSPRRLPCNIHQVLDQVIRAEDVAFNGRVRFVRNFDPSLPSIMADGDHLHEAFQNVIRNAAEAIIESGVGGQVVVTSRFSLERQVDHRGKLGMVRSLRVTITDNGPGIAKKDQAHIYDMFKTTKSNGSGLGLTVASQVIAAHDGKIELDSRSGQTSFSIYLPIVSDA